MKQVVVRFSKEITGRAKRFLCELNNSEVKELTDIFKQQIVGKEVAKYEIKFKGNIIHCLMYGDRYIKVYVNDVKPIK